MFSPAPLLQFPINHGRAGVLSSSQPAMETTQPQTPKTPTFIVLLQEPLLFFFPNPTPPSSPICHISFPWFPASRHPVTSSSSSSLSSLPLTRAREPATFAATFAASFSYSLFLPTTKLPAPLPSPFPLHLPLRLRASTNQQGALLMAFGRLVGHVNAATSTAALGGVAYALWNEFYRLRAYNRALTALNLKCKRLMEARRAAGLLRLEQDLHGRRKGWSMPPVSGAVAALKSGGGGAAQRRCDYKQLAVECFGRLDAAGREAKRRGDAAGAYDLQQWTLRMLKQGGLDPGEDVELYQRLHSCLDEVDRVDASAMAYHCRRGPGTAYRADEPIHFALRCSAPHAFYVFSVLALFCFFLIYRSPTALPFVTPFVCMTLTRGLHSRCWRRRKPVCFH